MLVLFQNLCVLRRKFQTKLTSLLIYSNLCWGPVFIGTQCITKATVTGQTDGQSDGQRIYLLPHFGGEKRIIPIFQ